MSRPCNLAFGSVCSLGVFVIGFATACSSSHRAPAGEERVEAEVSTGSLRLGLSARGESGALYRLRDAFFQVRQDNFGFFTTLSTENDPAATTLEATLPVGNFFVDFFGSFSLEKIDANGTSTRVAANLVSPSTQSFSINTNEETFVTYSFETNGEVIAFGNGRLVIDLDVTERAGESRRTVMETSVDALSGVSLRSTLDAALANAGTGSVSSTDVYHAMIDSYNQSPGRDAALRHCDSETTDGGPSLNGFPLACPRLEGQQFDNLDSWFPIAFVNRFDLAPTDGANCGQQRMIFANNSFIGNGRMFIIMEAQVPNPTPECGIDACRPIAELWSSLATVTDASERGRMLTDAFLFSGTGSLAPFMNANHLGPVGGQIRTNNFNDGVWTLREFHMQPEPSILPLPSGVAEAPNGDLWNDLTSLPQGEVCRESILAAIPGLLGDNIAAMGFPVADVCEDAESPNDFFRQDYATHLSFGSGDFVDQIADLIAGSNLSPDDVANRARFAGSCMGCHIEAGGRSLGNGVTAPNREDFVQVSEFASICSDGSRCFEPSEAVRTVFLPHRIEVMRNFLELGTGCGVSPAVDAGVDFRAAADAANSSAPRRTLGGQPVVEHAH